MKRGERRQKGPSEAESRETRNTDSIFRSRQLIMNQEKGMEIDSKLT